MSASTPTPIPETPATTAAVPEVIARSFDFKDVKIVEVAKHNCVRIAPTATVKEALHVMKKHGFSAIPVYDKKEKIYLGAIDYFAVMAYVAFGSFRQLVNDDFTNVNFEKLHISDLMSLSKETCFLWEYDPSTSLETILEPLSKGFHRVTMKKFSAAAQEELKELRKAREKDYHEGASTEVEYPPDFSKRKIISQRDVVSYLFKWATAEKNYGKRIPLLESPLSALGLTNRKPVISVSETTPAVEAFQKMYTNEIQSVAVTNAKGEIQCELSVSDLRNLNHDEKLPLIFLPTLLFLREVKGKDSTKPIVTATAQDTLYSVMEKLVHANAKRVWLVKEGDHREPEGVITLSDVISKFAPHDVTLNK